MDVAQHMSIIWRRKWWVLGLSVVIAAIAFAASSTQADVYRAQATVSVTPARLGSGAPADETTTLFLARSYAALGTTRPVVDDAVRRSSLAVSTEQAQSRLSVSAGDAGFLTIAASGPSPTSARALAEAESTALLAAVQQAQQRDLEQDLKPINDEITLLESQLRTTPPTALGREALSARYDALVAAATQRRLEPADRLAVVAPARAENGPVQPRPKRNATLALLVALVVNAELFVLKERFSDRFTTEQLTEDLQQITGLPVLARVPDGDEELIGEAFNSLRTNLLFMDIAENVRTLAVVSVEPAAGKSFTCIRLARSIGKLNVPTVLIDADMRRPVVHERLGLPQVPGFSNALRGRDLAACTHLLADEPSLAVIPAGEPVADPAVLLAGPAMRGLLRTIPAEMIIVDTPAEGVFADAAAIASQCDVAVLVIDLKNSRRRTTRALVQRLRQVNVNLIGVVINRADPNNKVSYYARYREKEPLGAPRS